MGVEVVHDQYDLIGLGVTHFEKVLDEPCPVLPGPLLGYLDVATTGQRLNLQEDFADTVANLFMVDQSGMPDCSGNRRMHLPDELFIGFVHTDYRPPRIQRQSIDREHVLHVRYESRVAVRRDLPVFAPMRRQFVFFSDRCTVIGETVGAIFSSTSFSASKRTVQRARPSGAGEHARAVSRASNSPP